MKNIFVGNLSFQTAESDLRSVFEAHGTVGRVNIVTDRETGRSRGFAFIEMEDDAQGEAAIASLNGSQVDGRAVNVNVAKPREERGNSSGNRRERRW